MGLAWGGRAESLLECGAGGGLILAQSRKANFSQDLLRHAQV
jgi:hypothetical protein